MSIRTFVAVKVSQSVRTRVEQLMGSLREGGVKTTWVRPENLHLTLKFLGDTQEKRIADVCSAVEQVAANCAPFDLCFRGAGAFPNTRRPRTVWVGVTAGVREICALADAMDDQLHGLGFPKEKRAYSPHLTIGRVRGHQVAELARRIDEQADFDAGRSPVTEVVVFASQLAPTGATYDILGRTRLGRREN